uniref:G-protein coupled receptors family 1 profile domain-containing protein n=1 Tax=Knipowitschia caucasica TaxID=637954 RepID=A0AAV2LBR6_KNICA
MPSKPSDSSNFMDQLVNFTLCQEDLRDGQIVWCTFSIFFFVLGFPAYVCIFYEWCQKYNTGSLPLTPYNFFMLNLTIMDWGFLVTFPFGLGNHFLLRNWVIESIWNGIYALSFCGRPLIMACVCMDCYLAVVYPLLYRNWTTLHPRIAVALFIWLVTVSFGLLVGIVPELYLTFIAVLPYVLALLIIIICDGFILYTLMKASPGGKTVHPQKQRAIETITTSLAASLLSYMPPGYFC